MGIAAKVTLRTARREAGAVVRAMGEGKHFLLPLKVAPLDRETEARFLIKHLEFFLVPGAGGGEGIRPEHASHGEGPADREGGKVTIRYRAVVTEAIMIMEGAQLRGLSDFHIWSDDFLTRQAAWDPKDPVFLATCKVQRIDPPLEIPWNQSYGGPDDWFEIDGELPVASFESVVEHDAYLKVAIDVKKAFAEAQKNPVELPAPPPKPAAAAKAPPPKPAAAAAASPAPPKPAAPAAASPGAAAAPQPPKPAGDPAARPAAAPAASPNAAAAPQPPQPAAGAAAKTDDGPENPPAPPKPPSSTTG